MLAHLTRKRLRRGNFRTGVLEYEHTMLRYSGHNAGGDEIEGPVCIVIDVGRDFTMTWDGKLYLTGTGKGQYRTFTPTGLVSAARQGWLGMTLLWDEMHDEVQDVEDV